VSPIPNEQSLIEFCFRYLQILLHGLMTLLSLVGIVVAYVWWPVIARVDVKEVLDNAEHIKGHLRRISEVQSATANWIQKTKKIAKLTEEAKYDASNVGNLLNILQTHVEETDSFLIDVQSYVQVSELLLKYFPTLDELSHLKPIFDCVKSKSEESSVLSEIIEMFLLIYTPVNNGNVYDSVNSVITKHVPKMLRKVSSAITSFSDGTLDLQKLTDQLNAQCKEMSIVFEVESNDQ
jgi:hypothetical protein